MIRFKSAYRLSSLSVLIASSTVLFSQSTESGQLSGKVSSSAGAPLVGATVRVESPQLMTPRVTRTDENGNYHLMLLPPGQYTLTAIKDGFRTSKTAQPIRLGLGAQSKQDFSLKPQEIKQAEAIVTVVATSASQDKSDPKVSINFSAEQLQELPTQNNSFEGAADLASGIVTGPQGNGTVTIRGGKAATAVFTVNGTTIGDEVNGVSGNVGTRYFINDSIEDTQVILSPLHGRYGRTGSGYINAATKNGGNEFSGSIRAYLTRNDWRGLSPSSMGSNATKDDFYGKRDLDIFFSGPIWKDHIWFAVSTVKSPDTTTNWTITSGAGKDPSQWALTKDPATMGVSFLPGVSPTGKLASQLFPWDNGKHVMETDSQKFYQGKITWAVNSDHTIQLERSYNHNVYQNDTQSGFQGLVISLQPSMATEWAANSYNSLNYRGALSSSLFLDASISEKNQQHSNGPATPYLHMRLYQGGSGMIWPYGTNINGGTIQNNANDSGSINLKWLADFHGSHEVDFGYQYYESKHTTQGFTGLGMQRFYVYGATGNSAYLSAAAAADPGMWATSVDPFGNHVGFLAANWTDVSGQTAGGASGVAPTRRFYTGQDGIARSRNEGVYVTDVWQPNNHWTILGALRVDRIRATDTDGSVLQQFWATPSPRVSVKYDLKGDSAHVFSFSAAKFTEGISAAFLEQMIHQGNSDFQQFGWSANPTGAANWVSYDAITNPENYKTLINTQIGSVLNKIQKLSSPYVVEFSLGYRRNRSNGSYVSVNLVNKDWYNDLAIGQDQDLASLNAYSHGKAWDGPIPSNWASTGKDVNGNNTYDIPRTFFNSKDIRRNYKALELEFKEVVSDRFLFGGSYTYSRLTGNDNGGDAAGDPGFTNNANPANALGTSEYYNFRNLILASGYSANQISPYGLLVADQTHKTRLYATYTLPIGKEGHVSFSLLGKYDSGQPYSAQDGYAGGANGAAYSASVFDPASPFHPNNDGVLGASPATLGSASWAPYYNGRGAYRLNDNRTLDFSVDLLVPLAWKVKFFANLAVENLLNTSFQGTASGRGYYGYDNTFAASGDPAPGSRLAVASPATFGTPMQSGTAGNPDSFIGNRSISLSMGFKF